MQLLYKCHKWNAQYWLSYHTAWLRPHAPTLKERTYEHQPTASPHGLPVGIAQGYSTIAPIPHGRSSVAHFRDLRPLLTWQLWLAKDLVREIRLPRHWLLPELTPVRAALSMLPILIKIGSPAVAAKLERKLSRMANWKTSHSKMSLSCGEKG